TDIIVGFPGETKKDFLETAKVMKKVKFDMAYIARYSPRPGTVSARFMKDDVLSIEKKRREKHLERILRKSALERNQKYVGKDVEAIVHETCNPPLRRVGMKYETYFVLGKTRTFKTVKFSSDKDLTGKIIKVRITKAKEFGLEGELL
ncbi:MAG: tRNA (N6-isopentenyl adenosine(37)-C2)-methylthiotransferase MiaB, partial [Candidatus Jacksonbacteria bacterium]